LRGIKKSEFVERGINKSEFVVANAKAQRQVMIDKNEKM
jgi:hypothetical protein